jgi:hypothetical protein
VNRKTWLVQGFAVPVTHINRKQDTYYLHTRKTKTGKPRYWFSKSNEGDLVVSIPKGYEVYENPDAQVFLRKIVPQLVTPIEVAVVTRGLERYAPGQHCIVDVQGHHIVVHYSERVRLDLDRYGFGVRELPPSSRSYLKVMRFSLIDGESRKFQVQRLCFRGSIEGWIDLLDSASSGSLADLVKRYFHHIG